MDSIERNPKLRKAAASKNQQPSIWDNIDHRGSTIIINKMMQTEETFDLDPLEKQKLNLQIQHLQAELENMDDEIEKLQAEMDASEEERIALVTKIESSKNTA